MLRKVTLGLLSLSLFSVPMLGGCDKKVAEDTTVKKNPDGSVQKDSKVTSTTQGGGTKTEETHSKTNP